jgi:RNA 3'-terminal phosphate cyclase (ATP)
MITIDGSAGEGGGQILRTAVALALCERRPCRIVDIRARRLKPGLRPQHLAAVRAPAEISGAEVRGASVNARELTFVPGDIKPGTYRFAIGTAGSTSLVLQTVLPALLTASGGSELLLEGGTHNPSWPGRTCRSSNAWVRVSRSSSSVSASSRRAAAACAVPAVRLEALHLETRGAVQRLEAI